ncbi:MAG TPA: hypothetical protein VGA18_08205 [Rhodothermales bacterium]
MAYATSNPPICLLPRVGSGGSAIWVYNDADAHTAVDADDYFTDGDSLGMKENDIVFVIDNDTFTCTLHYVRVQVTAPAASVNIATLS